MKIKKAKKPKPSKFVIWWRWPLIVLALSFFLSLCFGVLSEFALSGAGIAVSIVVILVFIAISIVADMVGVAITATSFEPFHAMAARKVRGAKEAIKLIENKEKVASVSADVIGDICGILAGAAGATITAFIIIGVASSFLQILFASLVSAVIAALTIFGKAYCKKYSILHCERIIIILGKFLSFFHISKKNKEKTLKNVKKTNKIDKNTDENKNKSEINKENNEKIENK